MVPIPFLRVHSCGNDFLILDNSLGQLSGREAQLARTLCRRGLSEGADGLLLVEPTIASAEVRMRLLNPDGSEAKMCANGAIAFSRTMSERYDMGPTPRLETLGGVVSSQTSPDSTEIRLQGVDGAVRRVSLRIDQQDVTCHYVDIYGVPHVVLLMHDGASADERMVREMGGALCHHEAFPGGVNVNFADVSQSRILLRTYERGVERETLSCGTGSIAAALVARTMGGAETVTVHTLGGTLRVGVEASGDLLTVTLSGKPRIVAEGSLLPESWIE